MKPSINAHFTRVLAAIALGTDLTAFASAAPLSAHPVAAAVNRGDCDAAIDLVKRGVASNDDQATYLGGRMLDEGVCVVQDHAAAARFFQRAADRGDRDASLEYAVKVGLGEGFEQSYERAGEICRSAGFDPQGRLSRYSLGYACTVRGVAGDLLRKTLPAGAFRPGTGALLVEFSPSSAQMRIRATPEVARESDAAIGSNLGRHRVNAKRAIESAWRDALGAVPKPDAARLDDQAVELSLDVDATLEAPGAVAARSDPDHIAPFDNLFPVNLRAIPTNPSAGH
jgi:TPR repeat protein